jgi:hypothetical protein
MPAASHASSASAAFAIGGHHRIGLGKQCVLQSELTLEHRESTARFEHLKRDVLPFGLLDRTWVNRIPKAAPWPIVPDLPRPRRTRWLTLAAAGTATAVVLGAIGVAVAST